MVEHANHLWHIVWSSTKKHRFLLALQASHARAFLIAQILIIATLYLTFIRLYFADVILLFVNEANNNQTQKGQITVGNQCGL